MTDLHAPVGRARWPTPIGLASGTCGYGSELDGLVDWSAVGAIFTKGLSLEPRQGHPPPRIWETPSGMLNAIGLENVGIEAFMREKMPFLRSYRERFGGLVLVNLFGTSLEQYRELAERLDAVDGVDGVEVNLSCPNVKAGGLEFGRTAEGCAGVTMAVRRATRKLVYVKLSPAGPVVDVGKAAAQAGADVLCMGNTMPAMAIDAERRRAQLSAVVGGMSGPALKPITLRMTYELARATNVPIVGVGGVACARDVIEYLLAGASAVQVGTATFANPNCAGQIRDELVAYLREGGLSNVTDLVGGLSVT